MGTRSPFGKEVRKKALDAHFSTYGKATASTAWEHVYRVLLSVDRRTRLAHVMDANHMQPGGNFHGRAVRFTDLLCKSWGITPQELPKHVDSMFQTCVKAYLLQQSEMQAKAAKKAAEKILTSAELAPEATEEASDFRVEIADVLSRKLGVTDTAVLDAVAAEIERKAEFYFNIEKKRQNVRGEGFEDLLERLLLEAAKLPRAQVKVRKAVNELPGFKPELLFAGKKKKDKVPKPDLALVSPDGKLTLWIVTAKWSLRQDRLDQFGQESAFYKDNKIQDAKFDFVLVTNEMDIARLRAVLSPPEGAGGFHFDRVYHVNLDLVERTQGDRFEELAVYKAANRLLSLADLFGHVRTLVGD